MEWEFSSKLCSISCKQIVNYLCESVDGNITVTGSRSDFDGSDCKSQSSDSESENQNTAILLQGECP